MEQLKPREAFWVRTVCLAIVLGLPVLTLFVLPALKLTPQPGFWARAAYWAGVSGFAALVLARRLPRRVD